MSMLDKDEILALVSNELANCELSDAWVSKKNVAEAYYRGDLPQAPDIPGRSSVTSTDCADAVEWILPSIVESLSGKAVKFRPCSAMDEEQAELETDYTHFLFNEENNGFLNLYTAAKDALLTGVGVLKCYYDDTPERAVEHYSGLMDPQLEGLLADPMVEVTQIERSETDGIAVSVSRIIKQGRVRVEPVPPEEFRVNDDHESCDLASARFVAHTRRVSASDLLAQGYDPDVIADAQTGDLDRDIDHDWTTNESHTDDESQKQIVITEAYMKADINSDGISELVKITVIGEHNPSEILDIEEVCEIPFIGMNAIVKPHSFYGVSVFDRLKQIQDLKTAILRSTMDSYYQSTNRMKVVQEGQVNLDDLLVSRPGGIIRAKGQNAVMEIGGSPIGMEAFQLLNWTDEQKRSRVGVSSDMAGQSQLVNNESAHAVERLMSAQEMLTGLIVRSIAETGIRPAYRMCRDLMVRHHNAVTPYKFRGKWQNINPADWGDRSRMMVTVGSGAGDEQQKMGALQQIFAIQQQLQQDPSQALVTPKQTFSTISDFINLNGLGDSEQYFLNPDSPEGQQVAQQKAQESQQEQQKQMEQQQQQLQMQQGALQAQQQIAAAEMQSAQAKQQANQLKAQVDQMKLAHQQEVETMKAQMTAMKEMGNQRFQVQKLQTDTAIKLTELELQAKRDLNKDFQDNQGAVDGSGSTERGEEGAFG